MSGVPTIQGGPTTTPRACCPHPNTAKTRNPLLPRLHVGTRPLSLGTQTTVLVLRNHKIIETIETNYKTYAHRTTKILAVILPESFDSAFTESFDFGFHSPSLYELQSVACGPIAPFGGIPVLNLARTPESGALPMHQFSFVICCHLLPAATPPPAAAVLSLAACSPLP